MDIPEELEKLKRPTLQKICKKYGVKANGKNSDMIAALEAIRDNSPESSEPVPVSMEEGEPSQKSGGEGEDDSQHAMQGTSDETTPTSNEMATPTLAEDEMEEAKRTSSASPASEPELSDDKALQDVESTMSRKRQRNSSLASTTANSGDVKKPKLNSPTVSSNTTECHATTLEEECHPLPKENDDTLPDITNCSTQTTTNQNQANEVDDPLPLNTIPGGSQICSAVTENTESAHLVGGTQQMEVSEPAESDSVGSTSPPFTPPSGARRSGQRKRKRNATYTKDSSESQEESTPVKRQRRATYELSPSSSLLRKSGGEPLDGPCDSTIPLPIEKEESSTESATEAVVADRSESDPAVAMVKSNGTVDDGSNAKDDIMSLLEQRVMDRKADPNYVPVHHEEVSHVPVKSQVQTKFDKAHNSTFSKMKSISEVYQEGVARQKSLGERRVATPRLSSAKKKDRRDSLTARARATMKSVTPSKPMKRLPEPKKPWETSSKHTSTAAGGGKEGFKPSTNTGSFKFSSTNKMVKFEGTLKSANDTSGIKKPSTPAASGSHSKTMAMKQTTVKKTKENSPVKSAAKRQTFDLQASLKKKNPNYKPYTGKLPPVHFKK